MDNNVLICSMMILFIIVIGMWAAMRHASVMRAHAQPYPYAVKVSEEMFTNEGTQKALLGLGNTVFFQGTTLPLNSQMKGTLTNDLNAPTIDGSVDAPHSLAMLSFNKASPECCPSSYSTNGGCVCMTDAQKDFIGYRGAMPQTKQ